MSTTLTETPTGTEMVFGIDLYYGSDGPSYDAEGYVNNYCGCWHVPCPDDDPLLARLDAAGIGRFADEDDPRRAFFFAEEIDEQIAAAEAETGCFAEDRELRR